MTGIKHVATLLMLGAAPAAIVCAPTEAQAQQNGEAITLPAQSLADTLEAISRKTGVEISINPQLAAGITSGAVNANTVEMAISQALAGTDLSFSGSAKNGYLIGRTAAGDANEIVVRARRDEAEQRYLVKNADSSTRDGRSLRDQPQSTTVISSKLIRDQQVQTVAEALRNASGATVNLGNVQGQPSFTVRGFDTAPLSGGLVDPAGALSQSTANIERIEVLKGPAAILAGADNFGGTVNIVAKKPTIKTLLDVSAQYGRFDDLQLTLDGSTALDPAKKFSARLVLQYARADDYFGGLDGRFDNSIAPSIRFKDSTLDLTVGANYSDQFQPAPPFGLFDRSNKLVYLPDLDRGPAHQGFRNENRRFYYDGSLHVTDWLTLVSRSHRSLTDSLVQNYAIAQLIPPGDIVFRSNGRQKQKVTATDDYARAEFTTGPVKYTVSAGFNYSDLRIAAYRVAGARTVLLGDFLGGKLAFMPFQKPTDPDYNTQAKQSAYYAQAVVRYGPLSVSGGARQNDYTSTSYIFGGSGNESVYKADKLTPNVGAVLDITSNLSIYANYLEGFRPNFTLDASGSQLPAETSRNIEAGLKLDMMQDRLSLVLSGYRLRQRNISVYDPTATPPAGQRYAYTTVKGQESKGLEADLTGEILPGWSISASYSYATYDLLEKRPNLAFVAGQPKHRYNLFTRYDIQHGALKNLGLGVGFFGFSKSLVDASTDRYVLPGQQQLDVHAYYRIGRVTANLGVFNVLDDKVYGVTRGRTYVPITPDRSWRLSLSYSFF